MSIIIGKNGGQLKSLQSKSFTNIVVVEKSSESLYRNIEITGAPIDIEKAVKHILIMIKGYTSSQKTGWSPNLTKDYLSKINFLIPNDYKTAFAKTQTLDYFKQTFSVFISLKPMKFQKEGENNSILVLNI